MAEMICDKKMIGKKVKTRGVNIAQIIAQIIGIRPSNESDSFILALLLEDGTMLYIKLHECSLVEPKKIWNP